MDVIFEINQLINNYRLRIKVLRDWISCNLDVILDPSLIYSCCKNISFVSQLVGVKDKSNWLFVVTLVNV